MNAVLLPVVLAKILTLILDVVDASTYGETYKL